MPTVPTVVLVHGAFADSASFATVVPRLLDEGLSVVVPAVPNHSLVGDAAYIASVVRQIDGPVLLVGHSYGGAVITVAGVEENVVGLVYLAGYALAQGESLGELQGRFPDSDLATALVYRTYPVEGGPDGTDVYVDVDRFPAVSAAGVDPQVARVLAVSQRPLAGACRTAWSTTAGVTPTTTSSPASTSTTGTWRAPSRGRTTAASASPSATTVPRTRASR